MQSLQNLRREHRWELLLKEIDQIHSTVKNLDDIIHKTKNFGFLFWGGSLYLIIQFVDKEFTAILILLTAIIPILFWAMDYRWRKHLLQCGQREKNISHFLNSEAFEQLILLGKKNLDGKQFPLFDVVGWIYTKDAYTTEDSPFDSVYLIDPNDFKGWRVVKYKDALWFYGVMILVSLIFGLFNLLN